MSIYGKNTSDWWRVSVMPVAKWKFSLACIYRVNVCVFTQYICLKWSILSIVFFFSLFIELSQLTGVAAILRFPMPELEEDDDDDDDDDDSEWKRLLNRVFYTYIHTHTHIRMLRNHRFGYCIHSEWLVIHFWSNV